MDFYRWELWLVCILFILFIIWIYIKITDNNEVTVTSTKTGTKTETKAEIGINSWSEYRSSSRDYTPSNGRMPIITSLSDIMDIERTEEEQKYLDDIPISLSQSQLNGPELPRHIMESRIDVQKHQSKGEAECKRVLEDIYGLPFDVQVRNLDIIKNPKTGRNLELDLYCPSIKIACEYNGRQHYEVVPRFHKNGQADLDYQQWKDNFKVDMCDAAGIYLITVPYNVPINKINDFIHYYLPDCVAARRAALNR